MASAFERLSKPGARHAALAPLVGEWGVRMTTHDPEGRATRSDDVVARKEWFGDGRYVHETVTGPFAGTRHDKLTVLGFNNVRGRYEYVTADNHDAVILLFTSAPGADLGDGRRIELFAPYVYAGDEEPVAGTLVTIRTVIEIESDVRHVLRNFYGAPSRPEYLFLEYDYRRRA